jgi:predicted dinucleotide-binding enzyme
MTIGIVGSGNVGGALGRHLAHLGHRVTFGTRKPDSAEMQELAKSPNTRLAPQQEAAQSSEVILLATPWPATEQALKGLGDLNGKILLDCTNPFRADLSGLDPAIPSSGGEMVAQWAPGARVAKVFNTVGYGVMANTTFPGGPAVMFYCGDDAGAKSAARDLAGQMGFDPVDAGPLRQSRVLESFALLWVSLAIGGQGRDIAFRLLKR